MATNVHPLLMELFKLLPEPGSVWPQRERVAWFDTMVHALVLIYGPVDGKITVEGVTTKIDAPKEPVARPATPSRFAPSLVTARTWSR